MRNLLLGVITGIVVTALFSFTVSSYIPSTSTADVIRKDGLLIFSDSKPVMEYEIIGSVKSAGGMGGGQYEGVRDRLITKTKKDFPSAEGIILQLKAGGIDKADVIRFK